MGLKTQDLDTLAVQVGNLYEAVAIMAKRSRQISVKQHGELQEKLAYYEGFDREVEDTRLQEDQAKVSLQYEVIDKPAIQAIEEMFADEVYYRRADEPTED